MNDFNDPSQQGEIKLSIIRVTDSGNSKNSHFGTVLLTIKHQSGKERDLIQIKITPVTQTAVNAAIMGDKLSINKIEATVDHKEKLIRLGPDSGIQLEENLQGRGIGAYAFNELFAILKKTAPTYTLTTYEVVVGDDYPQSKKEMLVGFLDKFNIYFSFSEADQRLGVLRPIPISQIANYYNASKVQELDIEKYFFQMIGERTKAESEINLLKNEVSRIGDESFAGIPKSQLVKYTLVSCALAVLIVLLLII